MNYYSSYVDKFIAEYKRLSIPNLKTELVKIPPEQFGRKDKFYKAMICFAKYLIDEQALDPDFLEQAKPLKPRRHLPPKRISVNDEGIDTLLGVCETPLEKALVILLASTGLRASECCDLTLDDVDLDERTLLVRLGKGNKTRRVGLPASTVEALWPLAAWISSWHLGLRR